VNVVSDVAARSVLRVDGEPREIEGFGMNAAIAYVHLQQ